MSKKKTQKAPIFTPEYTKESPYSPFNSVICETEDGVLTKTYML